MQFKVRPAFILCFSIFLVLVGIAACKSTGAAPGGSSGGGASESSGTTFFPRIGQ